MNENILNKELITRVMTDEELLYLKIGNTEKISVQKLEEICHFPKKDIGICMFGLKLIIPVIHEEYLIRTPTHLYIGRIRTLISDDGMTDLESRNVIYIRLVRDGDYYTIDDFKCERDFEGDRIQSFDDIIGYFSGWPEYRTLSTGYHSGFDNIFNNYGIPIPDYCMQDEDGKYLYREDIDKKVEDWYKSLPKIDSEQSD